MNEQAPQHPHLEEYPNAIRDPAKAAEMAYASKEQEEKVVANSNAARKYANFAIENIAQHYNDADHMSAEYNLEGSIKSAEQARVKADEQAAIAGNTYDRLKAVKR